MITPKIVRINLESREITQEILDANHPLKDYAGRALTSKIIADEVPPLCDALGPDNKFIIACGFLTGTPAPNSGRGSIGGKSPLTGGIKESNVGGRAPAYLARNNIRGLIFEKEASSWIILKVVEGKVEILDGTHYAGLNNYALAERILADFGSRAGAITIGMGGELLFANSSVACLDMEGFPSRHAGRGGLGAVMGSKKIKAVIVMPPSKSLMEFTDRKAFKDVAGPWYKDLNQATKKAKHVFGTPGAVTYMNELHGLPTQNYRRGQYKDVDMISGEAVHALILKNKGKFGLACSPGCAIQCSNMIMDADGKHVTSSLEYETIGLLGSNLMNNDILKISEMDHLCDDLGIDTIETGSCLGIFMEAGKIAWSDADACIELIKGIYTKNPESMMLGLGVYELGKKLNVDRIPHVKHQAFPSYEPRALKAPAITFLTGPMGADHTAGDVDGDQAYNPEGKLVLSKDRQIYTYMVDSMGICYFVGPSLEKTTFMSQLMTARYGTAGTKTAEEWVVWARGCMVMEREFNTKAGLSAIDILPKFMREEPLEEINYHWDFAQPEIDTYWNDF